MKLLLENWKKFITESHNLEHTSMDISDKAQNYPEDPKLAVKQYLLDNNFKVIGIGQGRAIIRLDVDKVAKIAFNQNGMEQNNQEASIWEKTKSNLLVPIIKKFDSYIISSYADPCEKNCEEEIEIKKRDLKKLLSNAGVQSLIDIHNLTNWGIHNGEVKLLDYGS
jgi:hypothetical protein